MKNNLKFTSLIIILFLSFSFTSCLTNVVDEQMEEIINEEEEEEQTPDPCADITYSNNVKPIIDSNCIQCHGVGGNSPNLTTYDNIKSSATSVKNAVISLRMPQGGSLLQAEIDAIECWVNDGALNN